MAYLFLVLAILSEVVGTIALKLSDGFSQPIPTVVTGVGYLAAFFFLGLCLKNLNIGFAYAVWAGIGIVLVAGIGALFLDQKVDLPGAVGISLIVAGVVVLNVFSKMSAS